MSTPEQGHHAPFQKDELRYHRLAERAIRYYDLRNTFNNFQKENPNLDMSGVVVGLSSHPDLNELDREILFKSFEVWEARKKRIQTYVAMEDEAALRVAVLGSQFELTLPLGFAEDEYSIHTMMSSPDFEKAFEHYFKIPCGQGVRGFVPGLSNKDNPDLDLFTIIKVSPEDIADKKIHDQVRDTMKHENNHRKNHILSQAIEKIHKGHLQKQWKSISHTLTEQLAQALATNTSQEELLKITDQIASNSRKMSTLDRAICDELAVWVGDGIAPDVMYASMGSPTYVPRWVSFFRTSLERSFSQLNHVPDLKEVAIHSALQKLIDEMSDAIRSLDTIFRASAPAVNTERLSFYMFVVPFKVWKHVFPILKQRGNI